MAKRGGFPGGGMPGNMANLMKQAQRMQRQMEEQQKELEAKEFTATAGGGAVEVASLTPTVEGVAVVCEGGGSAQVQNDIYEVIYALYGLSSSHVTVEKMR